MNFLNHKNLSDEDLIVQISLGDHLCFLELFSRYEPRAYKLSCSYIGTFVRDGINLSELASIAMSSIVKAIKKYNASKGMFYSYWKQVAVHDIQDYAYKNSYRMGGKTFDGLSLNDSKVTSSNELVFKEVGSEDKVNEDKFLTEEFYEYVNKKLSNSDKKAIKVLSLLLKGYSVNEIAKIQNASIKTIYYHISSLKRLYKVFIAKVY